MFGVIAREKTLASRVTVEVEKMILDSHLQPGDRLPAERELAAQFCVSRTVVREAVRALMAKGMVEVRQGSGTIVRTPSASALVQPMTMLMRGGQKELDYPKVAEVRRLIEVEIAGLAAARRTADDILIMEAILARVDEARETCQKFVDWDIAFHAALAKATANELLGVLLESVSSVLRQLRELGYSVKGTPDRALAFHKSILEQVRLGSVSGARAAMEGHLEEGAETVRRAMTQKARQTPAAKNGLRK